QQRVREPVGVDGVVVARPLAGDVVLVADVNTVAPWLSLADHCMATVSTAQQASEQERPTGWTAAGTALPACQLRLDTLKRGQVDDGLMGTVGLDPLLAVVAETASLACGAPPGRGVDDAGELAA